MSLEIKGISKAFGDTKLFSGLDLTVESGEFVCLIGRSGLGKSTLLSILGSFQKPDSGEVRVHGQTVHKPDLNRIMVFQTFDQLFPWKTVEENILFPLKHSKRSGMDLELVLEKLELSGVRSLYPYQLSGGMKQRVALGRAIITRPDVLLMDEPFGSLDVTTRRAMQDLIVDVWKSFGISMIFVTHDVTEAIKLGDRILILADHQLTEIDNPIQRPRSETEPNFLVFQQEIIQRIK